MKNIAVAEVQRGAYRCAPFHSYSLPVQLMKNVLHGAHVCTVNEIAHICKNVAVVLLKQSFSGKLLFFVEHSMMAPAPQCLARMVITGTLFAASWSLVGHRQHRLAEIHVRQLQNVLHCLRESQNTEVQQLAQCLPGNHQSKCDRRVLEKVLVVSSTFPSPAG